MYGVVLTNHNILNRISNVHLALSSFWKKPTQRSKGDVVTRNAAIF